MGAAEPVAPPTTEITSVPTAAGGSKIKQVLKVTGSVIVGLLILAGAGFKLWTKFRRAGQVVEIVAGDSKAKPKDAESSAPDSKPVAMAPPVAPATSIVVAKGTPPPRKAGEDLQVISYEVQRAKEGSLQYVIGVVTNHSAKQFFNVKLEFELARKEGKGGDTATDLIRNLPANTAVPFKASIIGTAPVTGAKLAKLEGEKE
ncbi:MAG: hypothetical protein EBS05_08375 [Proteobacteria bacterium]|nr:hypothetical protein [Pseudomonadota bacterium]